MREVGGRGRGVQTVEEREEKRQTTQKERNHASGCCLLRGQVTQNEKLLKEHFIRAHPAQKGNVKNLRVCVCDSVCFCMFFSCKQFFFVSKIKSLNL